MPPSFPAVWLRLSDPELEALLVGLSCPVEPGLPTLAHRDPDPDLVRRWARLARAEAREAVASNLEDLADSLCPPTLRTGYLP